MYDVKSKRAEDFISHKEIIETLRYAEDNKNNIDLLNNILKKAELGKGLNHREAAVLLYNDNLKIKNQIFKVKSTISKSFNKK